MTTTERILSKERFVDVLKEVLTRRNLRLIVKINGRIRVLGDFVEKLSGLDCCPIEAIQIDRGIEPMAVSQGHKIFYSTWLKNQIIASADNMRAIHDSHEYGGFDPWLRQELVKLANAGLQGEES